MRITRVQDDGNKFIIHGEEGLRGKLSTVFDQVAPGVSVTESEKGTVNILYTENNRDIVLRILNSRTTK